MASMSINGLAQTRKNGLTEFQQILYEIVASCCKD